MRDETVTTRRTEEAEGGHWTLMGAPLGRVHVTDGPSLSSPEQPDGIGVEVEVVRADACERAIGERDKLACEDVRLLAWLADHYPDVLADFTAWRESLNAIGER